MDKKLFIEKYVEAISDGNAAIFAGAGLSVAQGFVDWKGLLKHLAKEINLDIEVEHDLVSLAQYHTNSKAGNRHAINQTLIEEFSKNHKIGENHRILARLPIATFWTTNYDRLIENALAETGKRVDTKYDIDQLPTTLPRRDVIVYKMHGDIEHANKAVITKDDYEKYQILKHPFITALAGDMISKTFLFIGFSFTDPNLDYILSRIRATYDKNQRHHYCIQKKRSKNKSETDEQFEYAKIKQALIIEDLKRFGIQTVLVDEYSEITTILQEVEKRFKRKTVFISGSAHTYGDYPDPSKFISGLAEALIEKGIKVVSGFGLGVGSDVITGALNHIYINQNSTMRDQLILRPFPQGGPAIKENWEKWRQDMVSYAGIAIFIFGNKINENDSSGVINAAGVMREFEIAKMQGLSLIPIGNTGFAAEELWKDLIDKFEEFYPNQSSKLKTLFEALGKDPTEINTTQTVMNIISHLTGEA